MRIGLITMHNVCNFGAVLQTYATTTVLNELGHECTIIDYVPPVRKGLRNYFPIERDLGLIRKLASWVKWLPVRVGWQRPFNKFMDDKYVLTRKYIGSQSLMEDPPIFDAYITGSDQVWNLGTTDGFDAAYYLAFAPKEAKKISYAASISLKEFTSQERTKFISYVEDFNAISVREKTAIDLLSSANVNNVHWVLDPTLLLNKNEWKSISDESNIDIDEKYLLIYALGDVKDLVMHAVKIGREKNLRIVKIGWDIIKPKGVDEIISFANPQDFIKVFMNADFVVTNSFHGTAFSINFNKDFVAKPSSLDNPRFISILELFDLKERCFNGEINNIKGACQRIDFSNINEKLKKEREDSLGFLNNSLIS